MSDFKLAVDENNKATELPLLRVCGTVQQNPHMRAFWGATFSFFLAFLGWFALAPLGVASVTCHMPVSLATGLITPWPAAAGRQTSVLVPKVLSLGAESVEFEDMIYIVIIA